MIVFLVFAIPLGLAFLWLALCYPQQPSEDRPMVQYPDLPGLSGGTPKYVPPQEVAKQYYSHVQYYSVVRELNKADSLCGETRKKEQGSPNIAA